MNGRVSSTHWHARILPLSW